MDNKQTNKEKLLETIKNKPEIIKLKTEAEKAGIDTSNPRAVMEFFQKRNNNAKSTPIAKVKTSEPSQEKMVAIREKLKAMMEAKKQQNNVKKENDNNEI